MEASYQASPNEGNVTPVIVDLCHDEVHDPGCGHASSDEDVVVVRHGPRDMVPPTSRLGRMMATNRSQKQRVGGPRWVAPSVTTGEVTEKRWRKAWRFSGSSSHDDVWSGREAVDKRRGPLGHTVDAGPYRSPTADEHTMQHRDCCGTLLNRHMPPFILVHRRWEAAGLKCRLGRGRFSAIHRSTGAVVGKDNKTSAVSEAGARVGNSLENDTSGAKNEGAEGKLGSMTNPHQCVGPNVIDVLYRWSEVPAKETHAMVQRRWSRKKSHLERNGRRRDTLCTVIDRLRFLSLLRPHPSMPPTQSHSSLFLRRLVRLLRTKQSRRGRSLWSNCAACHALAVQYRKRGRVAERDSCTGAQRHVGDNVHLIESVVRGSERRDAHLANMGRILLDKSRRIRTGGLPSVCRGGNGQVQAQAKQVGAAVRKGYTARKGDGHYSVAAPPRLTRANVSAAVQRLYRDESKESVATSGYLPDAVRRALLHRFPMRRQQHVAKVNGHSRATKGERLPPGVEWM